MAIVRVVRRSAALVVAMAMVLTGTIATAADADPPDPNAEALRDGLASFVASLTGISADDALVDPIPLTPADLPSFLGLDSVLIAAAADIVLTAGDTFEELQTTLTDGIDLPSDMGTITGSIDTTTSPITLDLDLDLERTDTVPIAINHDLLGLTGDGPTLTAGLHATARLELHTGDLLGAEPGDAVRVQLTGDDAAQVGLHATLDAAWTETDPLEAHVGILAVDVTGTAGASFTAAARINAGTGDTTLTQGTWESTSGLDLFDIPSADIAATAVADLGVTSSLDGLDGVTGNVTLDWNRADGPADVTDAIDVDLGDLGDFRNIVLEEVFAAIAQLSVSLQAVQVSGDADFDLPFVQARLQDLARANTGLVEWLIDLGLAEVPEEGPVVLLEDLDRELLASLGLLDVESILDSLADALAMDPGDLGLAYAPVAEQLTFDLGYAKTFDPIDLNLDVGDQFDATGLHGLDAAAAASATATPDVAAALGIALSLEFDPERLVEEPDADDLVTVAERLALRTDVTSLTFDVPVEASLALGGSVGFLGVDISSGGTVPLVATADDADHMVEVTLDGGDDDLLTLEEMVNALSTASSPIVADVSVQVPSTTLDVSASLGGSTALSGTLGVAWPDVTVPSGLAFDVSGFDDFLSFDFDPDDPFALLSLIVEALDGLLDELDAAQRGERSALADVLPLIGVDLSAFLAEMQVVREKIDEITTDPATTLQGVGAQLNDLIVGALADAGGSVVDPGADVVSLALDTSGDDPAVVVKLDLAVCGDATGRPACVVSRPVNVPFQLDLADITGDGALGQLVGLESGGRIHVDYLAQVAIHAGVQLPSVTMAGGASGSPSLFLLDSSGIALELDADVSDVQLETTIGPLAIAAGNADDPGVAKLAARAKLDNVGGGRVPLSQIGTWASGLDLDLSTDADSEVTCALPADPDDEDAPTATDPGDACARLPLYLGDTGVGDIVFVAPDLLDPSGWQLTVPDDLADQLLAAVLDLELLLEGLRYLAEMIETSLDGGRHGVKVPVVGDVLDGGADVAATIREFIEAIQSALDDPGADAGAIRTTLQDEVDDALDDLGLTGGVTVHLRCGAALTDCADSVSAAGIREAELELSMGEEATFDLPGFDVGIPGLRLGVDDQHALQSSVGWSLDLAVGVNTTDGFYVRTGGPTDKELTVGTGVTLPQTLYGDLALLFVRLDKITDDSHDDEMGAKPDDDLSLDVFADLTGGTDGKLSLHRLISGGDSADLNVGADVVADLRYRTTTVPSIPGVDLPDDVALPSLIADLLLKWQWNASTTSGLGSLAAPEVLGFRDVELNLGEFIEKFLGPILAEVKRFTDPFQPVIDTISAPIPGLSDLSVALGQGEISMLDLFEAASGADLTMVRRILGIAQLVRAVAEAGATGTIRIGDFDLDGALAMDRQVAANDVSSLIDAQTLSTAVDQAGGIFSSAALSEGGATSGASSAFTRSREGGGFSFPAFENPSQLFQLLVGGDVTLVRWESGILRAGFGVTYNFPPIFIGPVPIGIVLSASASIAGQIALGYDTYGVRRAVEGFIEGNPPDAGGTVALLFMGMFIDDWDEDGVDVPEVVLSAEFAAGAGVSLAVVSAGIELGLRATIDMNLRDTTGTGKIRIDQILEHIFTPICLFEVGGQIDVFMRAYLSFLFSSFRFTIFEFTLLRLNDILAEFCLPKPPNLGEVVGGPAGTVLVLNAGARGSARGVQPQATEEAFTVRPLNAEQTSFSVNAFGEYEEYHGITGVSFQGRTVKVMGDGGGDKDTFTMADGVVKEIDDDTTIDDPENPIDDTPIPFTAVVLLCGGAGEDVIHSGKGGDIVLGDGSCSVGTSGSGDSLTGTVAYDAGEGGGDGADRLYGVDGGNLMLGGGEGDQLYGGYGSDTMVGGSGNDVLKAEAADATVTNVLIGGSRIDPGGTDTGVASPGEDQLFGAAGPDVLIGDNGAVGDDGRVHVALAAGGADLLEGGGEADRLFGGPAVDEMYGGQGDDFLDGGPGNDMLAGATADEVDQPGQNVLVGGAGADRLVAHEAVVTRGESGITDARPLRSRSVPALLVGGSLYDTSSPGADTAWGGGSGDVLIGDDASPTDTSLRPSLSGDRLAYPSGLDSGAFAGLRARDGDGLPTGVATIDDHGGNDRLYAGGGNDTALGGPGDDHLIGGWPEARAATGSDLLVGGRGDDVAVGDNGAIGGGSPPAVTILANPPGTSPTTNRLIGGSVDDLSDPGDDRLYAGQGGDVLVGDNGMITAALQATVYLTHGGADHLFGSLGADRGYGGPATDVLRGGPDDDEFEGGPGNDELFGDAGDDTLIGGTSRDTIPSGGDELYGGLGSDALAGDNARIARVPDGATGLDGSGYAVELFDLPDAGDTAPTGTDGEDELSGGSGPDLLYGQNGGDTLFGDGGDDHLQGGPDDDELSGGLGSDALIGGSGLHAQFGGSWPLGSADDHHVIPAADPSALSWQLHHLSGTADGADLAVGGAQDDALAGDNARIERAAPAAGLDGSEFLVQLFDVPEAGTATQPHAGTAGADVLIGGTVAADTVGADLLYGQAGDDLLFGDDADAGVVPALGGYGTNGTYGAFAPRNDGGGDDRLEGGPDADELFGNPGRDVLIGGSDRHQLFGDTGTPMPTEDAAPGPVETPLAGTADGEDLLAGGPGKDALTGDNAQVDRSFSTSQVGGFTLHGILVSSFGVALHDVRYAGANDVHPGTAGDDVLIGGSIGSVSDAGDDLGFGQAGLDLLVGDDAQVLEDARRFAPLLGEDDGEDHLEGGPFDDVVFGNGGDDVLIGGSSDLAVPDAATVGVMAGSDTIVAGPGDDMGLGDNGRVEEPAPWWGSGVGGATVTPFDEPITGAPAPHPATTGKDLLIGGSPRGSDTGLLGEQTEADHAGHDLLHAQGDDDTVFGDDITVAVTVWTAGWRELRPDVSEPVADWPIASLDWLAEDAAASGGDDLLLGGPADDVIFGGPGQDDAIGGSWLDARHDGRDLIDGGPGHDVVPGDNAQVLRPLAGGQLLCQTYRHRDGEVAIWRDTGADGDPFACGVGTPDPSPDDGVHTRVVREITMLDDAPGATSGTDLIWGDQGDDDLLGQFDDTAAFADQSWEGIPGWRAVEWCRLDAATQAQVGQDAGAYLSGFAHLGTDPLDEVAFGGDVLCGGRGEDAMLGDQGVVDDLVEDGGREEVIAPQQPFLDALIFAEGTLTRQVTLSEFTLGGDDVLLGGDEGDWMHGGAGADLMNGNGGDDRLFGGDDDDVMWGGAGAEDHLYGGNHDDTMDVRPRPQVSGFPGDPAERFLVAVEGDTYDGIDHHYGGWNMDVMQADEGDNGPVDGDRLMDWAGVYNLWYVCPSTYGAWISIRSIYPGLIDYLIAQAEGDGAVAPGEDGTSGFNELAMVYHKDVKNNSNPPHPETPGHFTCGTAP